MQSPQGTNGIGVFKEWKERQGGVSTGSSRDRSGDEGGREAGTRSVHVRFRSHLTTCWPLST